MVIVSVAKSAPHPFQVDNFPSDTPRSVEGALFLSPGCTREVTEGEWEHLSSPRCAHAAHIRKVR